MARETAAQRKEREALEAEALANENAGVPGDAPGEDAPFNAVVVVREVAPDGGIGTKIILSGDVKPTEVETILKLGAKGWLEQIGL